MGLRPRQTLAIAAATVAAISIAALILIIPFGPGPRIVAQLTGDRAEAQVEGYVRAVASGDVVCPANEMPSYWTWPETPPR